MYISDNIRLEYLEEAKAQPVSDEVVDRSVLLGTEDVTKVINRGDYLEYYELWLDSCWQSALQKEEYKGMKRSEIMQFFMEKRFLELVNILNENVMEWKYSGGILYVKISNTVSSKMNKSSMFSHSDFDEFFEKNEAEFGLEDMASYNDVDEDYDEWKENQKEFIEEEYWNFRTKFENLSSQFAVFRKVSFSTQVKQLSVVKALQAGRRFRVGKYWSWDYDGAVDHWGNGNHEIVLFGMANKSDVEWDRTLALNVSGEWGGENEMEITMKDDAEIEIIKIEVDKKDIEINTKVIAIKKTMCKTVSEVKAKLIKMAEGIEPSDVLDNPAITDEAPPDDLNLDDMGGDFGGAGGDMGGGLGGDMGGEGGMGGAEQLAPQGNVDWKNFLVEPTHDLDTELEDYYGDITDNSWSRLT